MSKHSAQGIVLVKRKPENANGDVLKQQITLVAKDGANALKISDLSQFIKDLEGAGIVVSENQIDLIANKTYIRDGKSGTPIALFADGKLNANLIDADTITVNHLYAKSGQGGTVVGHFGNYEKSDAAVGEDKCPLWLGATTAANAPFRVTKNGAMYAVKGTIGGFYIGEASIGAKEGNVYNQKMYLCKEYIDFYDTDTDSKKYAIIGSRANSTNGDILLSLSSEINRNVSYTCAASISVDNLDKTVSENTVVERTGLSISVKGGGYGNHAIKLEHGDITGFRLNTKIITQSSSITNYDNIIVCKNTTEIEVLLPISPQKGQIFYIRQAGDGNVVIKAGGGYKMYGLSVNKNSSLTSNKNRQMNICIFDGTAWYANYYNG